MIYGTPPAVALCVPNDSGQANLYDADIGLRRVRDMLHQIGIGRRGSMRVTERQSPIGLSPYPNTFMVKLLPHEAMLIKRVYDGIAEAPWFNRNAVTERELLKLILRNYAEDSRDETALLLACRDEAQGRFSKMR